MNPNELYIELQSSKYDQHPYHRMKDWGEGMEIVEEVVSDYWRERFLINHSTREAYELMDRGLTLTFVTKEDVDWEDVKTLENNHNAYTFSAYYQRFAVEKFKNGVALVEWTLYPDGRYFMDEDGYGMEDNEESVIYGFIDKNARVVIPFQAKDWKELEKQRPEAEKKAKELTSKLQRANPNQKMEKSRIHPRNIGIWLIDQLRHPSTLFQRKTWGVFSVYAHVRRSDRLPKKTAPSKQKALEVAEYMTRKYGGSYSIYKCLYCEGWHIAKDKIQKLFPSEDKEESANNTEEIATDFGIAASQHADSSVLDLDRLLKLDIPDIAAIYGGIRGRTMSSKHQNFAWPTIKECGIKTIIDLREDGVYTRLGELCRKYGLEYFHYPVDNKAIHIDEMVRLFPDLCRKIDAGRFYIACAMGLHRTDIALCCYWVFHAAERGLPPPEIRGYRKAKGHDIDKIMRVLNAFYKVLYEGNGHHPFSQDTFNKRKRIIIEQAYR